MDDPSSFLTKGSHVEVNSHEDPVNGTWYAATVIHPPPSTTANHHTPPNKLVYLEYHNLLSSEDASSTPLREYANIAYVRPSPLPEPYPLNFQLNDVVDAFYRDAWWTGVVTTVIDDSNFVVSFQNPHNQAQFHRSELRIHRKWVGGRWFQPQKQGTAGLMYTVGKKVEVCFERESLRDCWVPATILKNSENNSFLVEYQQPGSNGEAISHKVTVDYGHIRPSPPHLRDKNFGLLEKVDAYYDFGWWSGVVTKELADNRYIVYFKHTKLEREFIYSSVRPHMEWKGGKWFNASQGDSDGRTPSLIDEQIEQTTPSIDKQSSVATIIIKRTKQKILDISGKDSPSTKKMQDEIVHDDLSQKTNHQSVGQSEGLDSEVTGATDESENLSHGKKVRRNLTTDSPRKRGRPSNELKNLQAFDKGSKVDSIKTRSQEIMEIIEDVTEDSPVVVEKNEDSPIVVETNEDITEDSPIPVVMGLQCNGMTLSQGNILQKLSIENTPNATETDTQQLSVPFSPSTLAEKKGSEGDTASVAPKRKRGRPPKLQPLSSETSVTINNQNGGVVSSAPSVVEGGQKKEVDLTTNLVTKSLEENNGLVKEQPEIQNAVPLSKDLDVESGQGTKKYSAKKGKRGKRKTISINTESQAQDSQDASKEKIDKRLEKDSATNNPESSVGKSLDTVSDDRTLSTAKDAPINVHGPELQIDNKPSLEGTAEQSSEASEKLAICVMGFEDLPFVRNMSLWRTIESMDAFRMLPQKPHFRPLLEGVKESAREGLAIGTMVQFSTVVDQTYGLSFDDPRSTIEDCLETLVELEHNGFDVEVIRNRLSRLLLIKDKQDELAERSKGVAEKIEEHTIQRTTQCDEELIAIDRRIKELQEKRKKVALKKEKWNSEIDAMEAKAEEIGQEMRRVGEEFEVLAATPL